MLPAPIHGKAVVPCPPIPLAQLSLHQSQNCLGTEAESHEIPSHADLRCGELLGKPEICVLQQHTTTVTHLNAHEDNWSYEQETETF
jgi:hypothetical protein